jgi:MoxR-like ATPase
VLTPVPASIDATVELLARANYIADRPLATAVFLALALRRPLFVEGEPGTGKTEIAKALSAALGASLIRLQCYEGLDIHGAAYEWNHARQMLEIRLAEAGGTSGERVAGDLYAERFLIERPLLAALRVHRTVPVLLIDEIDRADEPFEAYLLEVLSDFQITIPELGTIKAAEPPVVVITSNRTREVHDAVKRRCLYHWLGYPSAARELEIVRIRVPHAAPALSRQIVAFVQELRRTELYKQPGVAETIEWTRALLALDSVVLEPDTVDNTLGVLLKYQDDIAKMRGSEAARIVERIRAEAA